MKDIAVKKNISLPTSLNKKVIRAAKKEARTFSGLVQIALIKYLERVA